MTEEEINVEIATCLDRNHPTDKWGGKLTCPDYCNDSNAIRAAVESLRSNQFHYVHYPRELFKVIAGGLEWTGDVGYFFFNFVNPPPYQCAEAFLKTVEKWRY